MLATSLTFMFVIITAQADRCEDHKNLAPVKLKTQLLCGYEKTIRPVVNHKDPIKVVMRLILKYFEYSEHTSTFSVDSWMALFWKDEHLTWKPEDYESLSSIHLSDTEIWMPDISVYNRNDQSGSPAAIDSATCVVSNTGQVVCVPPARHTSLCVPDLTKYPFDVQNCTVRFGSWVHSGEEIDLKLAKPPVTTEDLVPNGEWGLVTTKVIKHPGKYKCCPNDTYPSINFSFELKRLSGSHAANVIIPALALIVITLTSLWVPPNHADRLTLCCVNLVCQFLYNEYLSWLIPMKGDKVPLLILFARDSLLLVSFTVIFSVVLRNMVENKKQSPVWVSTIVSLVIGCRPGQYLFLNDTSVTGVATAKGEEDGGAILDHTSSDSNLNGQDWFIFARILDRLCFTSYCIVYLTMFVAFTP